VPPGGFEPPPLPPEGSALSPELWGPRGVNNRSRSGGWSWTARVAPWTCRRHGREARCGPATGLPSARCVRRVPVRGSASRAAQQARTTHGTSHQMADPAPCERHEPVRGSTLRAALQARTTCATSHQTADTARCVAAAGLEARRGPATALPSAPCVRREPVRGSVFRAALHARTRHATSHGTADTAPCVAAAGREARCGPATGLPVRTVRPSRAGARFRVPCGAASAHHARNLAPDGGARTVPARPRQPAGVAVADPDGCSAARTASTTGCAPPGSVNSVDCAVIQYGSAKASARPTSPLRVK
jgi:hypothetical protein